MNFKCEKCGHPVIEEVMIGAVVTSVVSQVGEGGDTVYGPHSIDAGDVERFQCQDCGEIIQGVATTEELYKCLKEKEML